jgi:hypothetical protein
MDILIPIRLVPKKTRNLFQDLLFFSQKGSSRVAPRNNQ